MRATAAALLFFCAAGAAVASSAGFSPARVLYAQPPSIDLANTSIVRVDPSDAVLNATLVDFWRLGGGPLTPLAWRIGDDTGAPAPAAATRGRDARAVGSSAISYAAGVFGAVLNTTSDPIAPGQTLGTITMEQSWGAPGVAAPWAGGGSVDCAMEYMVPTAARAPGAIAVYSSWTLGIRSARDAGAFIWYETALFDLDRPLGGDQVWHDTISGNVILHGVLGAPSAFHTTAPDSAAASTRTWAGWRRIHFTVSAAQVAGAVAAANAKFNLTLSTDAAAWAIVHFNVELEGTAGVSAGHALRGLTIAAVP